jgi:helix-turn-helix protein
MTMPELKNAAGDLLDEKQAADFLKVASNTLSVWRSTKRYPLPYVRVGRCIRYKRSDLEKFVAENTVAV